MEWGYLTTVDAVTAIVDSGCTSTSVPEDLAHLVYTITEDQPKRKMYLARYLADGTGLDIIKIGLWT